RKRKQGADITKNGKRMYFSDAQKPCTHFRNGFLDPWSGGGWSLTPKTEGSLVSLILKEGAHHYDLRGAHPNDTEEADQIAFVAGEERSQAGEDIHKEMDNESKNAKELIQVEVFPLE
ncbi:hypothetical protein GCK32_022390, partial [Trichostrongylus colubriformis]